MEVMYSNVIDNNYFSNKNFIGFLGEVRDLSVLINSIEGVKLRSNAKVKRVVSNNTEFLNLLGLPSSLLKKKIKDLSYSEYKMIMLIKVCNLHSNLVILNNFDLGFNYKTRSKISRFIKTINATYNTKFIIISNDILFINKCSKHLVIVKNRIIKYQGDIINAIKQDLINKPEIIKFIDLANLKDANLDYTLDNKELLKAIYRSVF